MHKGFKNIILSFITCLFAISSFAAGGVMSGAGTDASPYMIEDYSDLRVVGISTSSTYKSNKVYKLANDIDASDSKADNSGAGFLPIGKSASASYRFTGKFYGAGYTIKNLYINRPTTLYVGLFGYVYSPGVIEGVSVDSSYIKGRSYVGAICGFIKTSVTINNCHSLSADTVIASDEVYSNVQSAGGICGYNDASIIKNSSNAGCVSAPLYVGGVLGYAKNTVILDSCSNEGDLYSTGDYLGGVLGYGEANTTIKNSYSFGKPKLEGGSYLGGVVGYATGSLIDSCYSRGEIIFIGNNSGAVAGGVSNSKVSNCSNISTINGGSVVGGIVGESSTSSLSNLYNTGFVNGITRVGGIVGKASGDTISACFNSGNVLGGSLVGGFAGFLSNIVILNTYSTGFVEANATVGGFLGQAFGGVKVSYSYATGLVSKSNTAGGFIGFNYSSAYPNSFFNTSTSNFVNGIGQSDNPDTTLVALSQSQMMDTLFIDSLDYASIWMIHNDSTYPALRGLNNAPFAMPDTLFLSAKDYLNPYNITGLLWNDFDNETLQQYLFLKIYALEGAATDSLTQITLPLDIINNDTIKLSYRVGEKLTVYPDSLWGNFTRSVLIMDNHLPALTVDSISLPEDSIITFPLDIIDIDGDLFTYSLQDSTKIGSILLHSDSISYTPYLNANGLDSLSIVVDDGFQKDTVWYQINVLAVNDKPQVKDTTITIVAGDFVVLAHPFSDPDDSVFTYSIYKQSTQGVSSFTNDTLVYSSNISSTIADTVKWFVVDEQGLSSDTVSIFFSVLAQTITASPNVLNFKPSTYVVDSVLVSSNTTWIANSSATWLGVQSTNGIGNDSLVISAQENNSLDSRSATVTIITPAGIQDIVTVNQSGKIQLFANCTVISTKEYDGTDTARLSLDTLIGVLPADLANVSVVPAAKYEDKDAAQNKTITLSYFLSGSESANYFSPLDSVINIGIIHPKQLKITDPLVTLTKMYDTNDSAHLVAGTLIGVESIDISDIGYDSEARYDSPNAGLAKVITVHYELKGNAQSNYLAPLDSVITVGEITPIQLFIGETELETIKMYDGNTLAEVISVGALSGYLFLDEGKVSVQAEANYNSSSAGNNKTITIAYSLNGVSAMNYLKPVDSIISSSKILMPVSLESPQDIFSECESPVANLPYTVRTGEPVEYRVVFKPEGHDAGLVDIPFTALPSQSSSDVISIPVPKEIPVGKYTASLQLRNEIEVPSIMYSFVLTKNLTTDMIHLYNHQILGADLDPTAFTSFQWYKNDQMVSGASSYYYEDKVGYYGDYMLSYSDLESNVYSSCVKTLSEEYDNSTKVQITPNPIGSDRLAHVKVMGYTESQMQKASLIVYDAKGMLVYRLDGLEPITDIKLSGESGVYLVLVSIASREYPIKVLVK